MQNFIEQSPIPMAITDGVRHTVRAVNPAFCAIYRKTAREILGRPLEETIPPPYAKPLLALIDRVYLGAGGATADDRVYLGTDGATDDDRCRPNRDQQIACHSYTVWAVPSTGHTVRSVVIQVNDCPESIHTHESRRRACDEMRDINEQLLLSSMRHYERAETVSHAERRLHTYTADLENQNSELENENVSLQELASTDGLTGLKNTRAFQNRLRDEFERSKRYGSPLSLILLDVDHFKPFNDTFGHPEGDLVLAEVGRILRNCARPSDCAARYGGEEFALILPQTSATGATRVAERIRRALNNAAWAKRSITASFGIAALTGATQQPQDLVVKADAAMYQAKANGRDCIHLFADAAP